MLVDQSAERSAERSADVAQSSDHWLAAGVDLTDPSAVDKLRQETHERFERIDVLINTVGASRGGKPVHQDDLENWDFLLAANPHTARLSCLAVIPCIC